LEAMSYLQDSAGCADWTDAAGDFFFVVDRPLAQLGDEAFSVVFQNDSPDFGTVQIETLYVRTGSVVNVFQYAVVGQVDSAALQALATTALAKLGR